MRLVAAWAAHGGISLTGKALVCYTSSSPQGRVGSSPTPFAIAAVVGGDPLSDGGKDH